MYLPDHARNNPHKPAMVTAGAAVSYAELDARSNCLAQLFYARGLRRGDHVAIFMENNIRFIDVVWAIYRSGLFITPINRYANAAEATYIAQDCGAKAIVSSFALRDVAAELSKSLPASTIRLMVDGTVDGWQSYEAETSVHSAAPLAREWMGEAMLYSSGTTGRPKGILRPLPELSAEKAFAQRRRSNWFINHFDVSADTVYLSPAPLYHSAPISAVLGVQSLGGTVVMMEKFDAETALQLIEQHRVTHSQWVPTMFVRMLKLSDETRARFDLSSHRFAIHAGAPCPVEVKHQMIDWWGPILQEYYSGTEGPGSTAITSEEWLAHPGSVGQASLGKLHICDEDGRELPIGESGLIYFERDMPTFSYHNDDEKTKESRHPLHPNWAAMGDIGYMDAEGYLYLTDRKAFMIISGGVNIYPRAIEDSLIMHSKVADVAVIGVPDQEMGEAVKAVVELQPGVEPSEDLAKELIAFSRERMAAYMVPRSIDFTTQLPRLPTGKLYKRLLRDRYWPGAAAGP